MPSGRQVLVEWRRPKRRPRWRAFALIRPGGLSAPTSLLHSVFKQKPVHLVAGEHSRAGWNVPSWALKRAASVHIVPSRGHMMMLEDPQGFGRLIRTIVSEGMSWKTSRLIVVIADEWWQHEASRRFSGGGSFTRLT
jgi:pimeloyl-ACP methyl ester carboxylesterase